MAVNSCFQCFYRLSLKITSFYATPIKQIIPCHVTDVKILRYFWFISSRLYWSQISPSFRNSGYLNSLQKKNVGAKSVGTKIGIWEKCTLSFLQEMFVTAVCVLFLRRIEHLTSHKQQEGVQIGSRGKGCNACNVCSIL